MEQKERKRNANCDAYSGPTHKLGEKKSKLILHLILAKRLKSDEK